MQDGHDRHRSVAGRPAEAAVVRRLRHADRHAVRHLCRPSVDPRRRRRTRDRAASVLELLAGAQHRPLRRAVSNLQGNLPSRVEEAFEHFGLDGADGSLIERYFEAYARFQLYPDVQPALDVLARHHRLAIVSNIDDDLLGVTPLGRRFDLVCTAERARGYKPDGTLFRYLLDHAGVAREEDPAFRAIAIHRHGRRQAARPDDRVDQPPLPGTACERAAARFRVARCQGAGATAVSRRRRLMCGSTASEAGDCGDGRSPRRAFCKGRWHLRLNPPASKIRRRSSATIDGFGSGRC